MPGQQQHRIALAGLVLALAGMLAGAAHADGRAPTAAAAIALAPLEDHPSSKARAINTQGEVAGFSFDGRPLATIWDRSGTPWPLAPLDGDRGSEAFAINDRGEVAGDSRGAVTSAVRWWPHRPPLRLAPPAGDLESFARGINEQGEVAGYSASRSHAEVGNGVLLQAVRWSADGEPTVLRPRAGDLEAVALAINDRGEVAGYSFNPGGRDLAVVWNRRGEPRALRPLAGEQGSEAHAINRRGVVAGDSEDGPEIATLWTRGGPRALPPLPADSDGLAFALNHHEAAGVSISEGLLHSAVRWRRGAPLRLPPLPDGNESWALGINADGDVVGFSTGEAGTTAVLWPASRHGGKRNLPAGTVRALDQAIAAQMTADNLPGLAVGVWVPDEGAYVVARGEANLATGLPRDVEASYRIGSITKSAIGTVILKLIEAGQLSKTDTIATWYPDFPNADVITIEDLLRMRSGIPDSADAAFLKEYYADPLIDLTAVDMIERSARRASEFRPPDQESVYTNVNFMILEQIAQKVGGASIGDQLEARIFAPLGMARSLYPSGDALPVPLHGYSWNAATSSFDDLTVLNPAPAGGAGAMISTLANLRVFARALCGGTLLSPALQEARLEGQQLQGAPAFVRYGEGIVLFGEFCGHNGTIFGFSSEMWYLPAKDAVVVINVNRLDEDDESRSSDLFLILAKILFPEHVDW